MTKDDIIRMAREAGLPTLTEYGYESLERFAALVATHVREKQAEHEPFDMNDHPPHRLCECRKCMEYFTPLPDCDAFAASGKPIAEEPVKLEHITDGQPCWCNPELNYKDPKTGAEVWVHKEPQ